MSHWLLNGSALRAKEDEEKTRGENETRRKNGNEQTNKKPEKKEEKNACQYVYFKYE